MSEAKTQSLPQLIDALQIPLQQQKTGVFFIATQDNASCRFAIKNGVLTHCSYKRLHGMEAVQAFLKSQSGKCSFIGELKFPFQEKDILRPEKTMELLGLTNKTTEPIAPEQPPSSQALLPIKTQSAPQPQTGLVYRGQALNRDTPPASAQAKSSKKRYYRGVLIER